LEDLLIIDFPDNNDSMKPKARAVAEQGEAEVEEVKEEKKEEEE
jgi:hypothetical protein